MPMLFQHLSSPFWTRNRGTNILDGGAPFYDTYKTKDGRYMAVYLNCEEKFNISGAIEPLFYATFLKGLELRASDIPDRMDQSNWSVLRRIFSEKFLEKSQSEWENVFDGTDGCVTPIIPLSVADNRPIATLSESPALDASIANVQMLKVGTGTNEILKEWIGWRAEKDYTIDVMGTVNIASFAKL
jgi:alpha-methylacyl-CoA racemase